MTKSMRMRKPRKRYAKNAKMRSRQKTQNVIGVKTLSKLSKEHN